MKCVGFNASQNHEQYLHKILTLTSEISTMTELEESYQKAAGKPIPAIPGPLGRVLVKVNKATQDLCALHELSKFELFWTSPNAL